MKKSITIGLICVLAVLGLTACKKAASPQAGGATAKDMLGMIPKNVQGVVVIDVHRGMTLPFVENAIKKGKENEKYQEFIKQSGIDPQKDVYFVVIGIARTGKEGENSQAGAGIVNLKYDKAALLAKLKEMAPDAKEEAYEGLTIYTTVQGEEKKPVSGAFLDDSNIVLGSDSEVKAVIDVVKKKAESVLKNPEIAGLIAKSKSAAILWSAFALPPDMMKDMAAKNPMMSSLESLNALLLSFDYSNKSLQVEITGMGGDADKNKQIAEFLTGLKALGGMASAKKPEVGDLMNKIAITSTQDSVSIKADLPEDLLTKLGATAEEQLKEKMAGGAPTEEKKQEKKEEKK